MLKVTSIINLIIIVFTISFCSLFDDTADDKSKISLQIDGEEIKVLGSSSMEQHTNSGNYIPSKATIRINIDNNEWGELRIVISEFSDARLYEAYSTYVGALIFVELDDKTNRTFIENSNEEITRVNITRYKKEQYIEGEMTHKLTNGSILSVSFYITNVTFSNKRD